MRNATRLRLLTALSTACLVASVSSASADVSFATTQYQNPTGSIVVATVSGDFNGDGKADIAIVGADHTVSFFAGAGNGTLGVPATTDISALTTDAPSSAVTGDFNHDGKTDLAIAYAFSSVSGVFGTTITVHFGDAVQPFSSSITLVTDAGPLSLAAGDFDFDGNADLVASAGNNNGGLCFFLGNGDGTFQPALHQALDGLIAVNLLAGNIDNHRGSDLVIVTSTGLGYVWIDAGFSGAGLVPITGSVSSGENARLALGDLNGDGNPDLAGAAWGLGFGGVFRGGVGVFVGDGFGRLTSTAGVLGGVLGGGSGLVLADINTDGKLDLVSSGPSGLIVALGDGRGSFSTTYTIPAGGPYGLPQLGTADFNGDGRPDLFGADAAPSFDGSISFVVLINTSPRGCVDTLTLGYANSTLSIGFTLQNAVASQWNVWLAFQNFFVPLWSVQVPALPTVVKFTLPLAAFPAVGNVGVLTTMSSPTYGLMCADWEIVDTGGIGPTAQTLSTTIQSRLRSLQLVPRP